MSYAVNLVEQFRRALRFVEQFKKPAAATERFAAWSPDAHPRDSHGHFIVNEWAAALKLLKKRIAAQAKAAKAGEPTEEKPVAPGEIDEFVEGLKKALTDAQVAEVLNIDRKDEADAQAAAFGVPSDYRPMKLPKGKAAAEIGRKLHERHEAVQRTRFARGGMVERFAAALRERFAKRKPAAGQASMFREEDHPRDDDGKFADKGTPKSATSADKPKDLPGQMTMFEGAPKREVEKPKVSPPVYTPSDTNKHGALLHGLEDIAGTRDLWNLDTASDDKPASVPEAHRPLVDAVNKAVAGNPFTDKASAARQLQDELTKPTAREAAMAESFPVGGGFGQPGAEKRIGQSVNRAVKAEAARKQAEHLEGQARAYDSGKIDEHGRRISKDREKTADRKQALQDRQQAAKQAHEGKEPWEVPSSVYADASGQFGGPGRELVLSDHREHVKVAAESGKVVPPHVLAEYPDLLLPRTAPVNEAVKGSREKPPGYKRKERYYEPWSDSLTGHEASEDHRRRLAKSKAVLAAAKAAGFDASYVDPTARSKTVYVYIARKGQTKPMKVRIANHPPGGAASPDWDYAPGDKIKDILALAAQVAEYSAWRDANKNPPERFARAKATPTTAVVEPPSPATYDPILAVAQAFAAAFAA